MILNFLIEYWKAIVVIISFISLGITIFKTLVNSIALCKIRDNHLAHIQDDINNIKKEDKNFKELIDKKLEEIRKGISRIERKQSVQKAVCDERHKEEK